MRRFNINPGIFRYLLTSLSDAFGFFKNTFLYKMTGKEWFDIIDENENKVGRASRYDCHNQSMLLHPVIHLHVFNSSGELLLQKRSLNKDIQPGKWDISVGGHIFAGESINHALIREAKEEIGITLREEIELFTKYIHQSEVEREYVYSFIYHYDGKIKIQKSEIDSAQFFTSQEIERLIKNKETTSVFNREFQLLKEKEYFK